MNKLNDYLQHDLEELINAINQSEELQKVKLNTTFSTLGEFADYWSKHLNQLQRTSKDNSMIEYR